MHLAQFEKQFDVVAFNSWLYDPPQLLQGLLDTGRLHVELSLGQKICLRQSALSQLGFGWRTQGISSNAAVAHRLHELVGTARVKPCRNSGVS